MCARSDMGRRMQSTTAVSQQTKTEREDNADDEPLPRSLVVVACGSFAYFICYGFVSIFN